jgi:acetylornithine/N-succinyldiaminopimelate aminotransferase
MSTTLASALLPAYPPTSVTFVDGQGCRLTDDAGRSYLDFVGGIAVIGLGHRHPAPLAAAHAQLDRLWHTSNLFGTQPAAELAQKLSARFAAGAGSTAAQAFFCNSGAESIEAAIKYARKATGKTGLVALEGSFHGRTTGALAVTGQPAKRAAFAPLLDAAFATLNDVDSLAAVVDDDTALVIVEPVQGEGGVNPATPEFLAAAKEIAHAHGALLLFDEVQTGVGRTGTFFAWEQSGVKPDLATLAKALANGLPIGALLVSDDAPRGFVPGDHASTFGGNPVACAAACAVLDTVDDEVLANVDAMGAKLRSAAGAFGEVRGAGLLIGVELDRPVPVADLLERGLLVSTAGPHVLRLTPPLVVSDAEVDEAVSILTEVLA